MSPPLWTSHAPCLWALLLPGPASASISLSPPVAGRSPPQLLLESIAAGAFSVAPVEGSTSAGAGRSGLRWEGLDLGAGPAFTGTSEELACALGDESSAIGALGCAAAALRLSEGNWTRYLQLGQECWAVPAAISYYGSYRQGFIQLRDKVSSRADAAGILLLDCAWAERDAVIAACVPPEWQETVAGLDSASLARLKISIVPLVQPAALVSAVLFWLLFAAFLWTLRAPLLWLVLTLVVGLFTLVLALYQAGMLFWDITFFTVVRAYSIVLRWFYTILRCSPDREQMMLVRQLRTAKSYEEWRRLLRASEVGPPDSLEESLEGRDDALGSRRPSSPASIGEAAVAAAESQPMKSSRSFLSRIMGGRPNVEEAQTDDDLLRENISTLRAAVEEKNLGSLMRTMRGQLTRNHAGTNRAGASGPGELWVPRPLVREYVAELQCALDFVADAEEEQPALAERLTFFKECQHAFGNTALCLSGGGALAMYHMGVCKELLHQGLLPNVISGTSGGSIVVAFLALFTDEELLRDIFVDDISTRYPERWFPPLWQELLLFARKGVLVRQEDFAKTTLRYFGESTFAEAYARTGRNVSITISTNSSQNRTGAGLLLNRLTTPDVTISSAVAASCALPGIMGPHPLYAKVDGGLQPFDSGGRHFIDGTMQFDLPKQRLAEMFHCNQFIVSQVNPHIAPFVRRTEARSMVGATTIAEARRGVPADIATSGVLRQVEDWMSMDIRHRVQVLSKFGLMPTLFGFDLGPVFKQSYAEFRRGVMLVPACIGVADAPLAIKNPTQSDMRHFLYQGQRCVWPKVDHIRHLLQLERALTKCISRLESRLTSAPA